MLKVRVWLNISGLVSKGSLVKLKRYCPGLFSSALSTMGTQIWTTQFWGKLGQIQISYMKYLVFLKASPNRWFWHRSKHKNAQNFHGCRCWHLWWGKWHPPSVQAGWKKQKQKNSQSHIFLATPLPFNGCHFAVFNTVSNLPKFTFMIKQP